MKSLQIQQASQMLTLQNQMNSTVNSNWLSADYPFLRAVVVEVAEALDHLGWKWWKKESPDVKQATIELIDILHFMLSHELVRVNGNVHEAATYLVQSSDPNCRSVQFDGKEWELDDCDPRTLLELLAGLAASRRSELPVLEKCFQAFGLTWEEVFIQYTSKNVLNIFRQNNGYKTGEYLKIWAGEEDNVHMVELLKELDKSSMHFSEDLYSALAKRYSSVIGGN